MKHRFKYMYQLSGGKHTSDLALILNESVSIKNTRIHCLQFCACERNIKNRPILFKNLLNNKITTDNYSFINDDNIYLRNDDAPMEISQEEHHYDEDKNVNDKDLQKVFLFSELSNIEFWIFFLSQQKNSNVTLNVNNNFE